MNYEQLESDIVAQIIAWLTDNAGATVDVAPLAEKQVDYKVAFENPRVFVCYQHSMFKPPKSTDPIIQDEDCHVRIMIEARKRTGSGGAFDTYERMRVAVTGFEPTNAGRLYVDKLEFQDFRDNVWYYAFTVICRTVSIQTIIEATGPPATQFSSDPPDGY